MELLQLLVTLTTQATFQIIQVSQEGNQLIIQQWQLQTKIQVELMELPQTILI